MADSVRETFVDLFSDPPSFVKGIRDTSQQYFLPPYHNNKLGYIFHFLRPNANGGYSAPYTAVDLTGASLIYKIWDITGVTVLASQTSWTADSTVTKFSGTVDLFTANMVTAITGIAVTGYLTAILEIQLTLGDGTIYTYRDNGFRIGKALNLAGSPVASGSDTYNTTVQSAALYVPQDGPAGGFFVMRSAAGIKLQIYVADLADGGWEFRAEKLT